MKKNLGRVHILMALVVFMLALTAANFARSDAAYAAGSYTIDFIDGSEIVSTRTVNDGGTLENVPEITKDGCIFAGWYTSNVNKITDIDSASASAYDFKTAVKGDLSLYAGWIEIGTGSNADFYLEGVQYRAAGSSSAGIRFITRINLELENSIKALNSLNTDIRPSDNSKKGLGYGTVVTMKSNIPANGMLLKDESAHYVKNGMVVVPAVYTYKYMNGSRYYTAVITGITESYFNTDMAARPYITYYDANGILHTYYYTEHGSDSNTYGGAYFTTYNKVVDAYNKEHETVEPTTEEPATEKPTEEPATEKPTEEPATAAPEYGDPDIVVASIYTTPAVPQEGDKVVFSAVVKNIGTASTPDGVITGVKFTVDGYNNQYMWSDTYTASIKPGESVVLTANGGVNGNSWTASSVGSYKVTAHVDDVNRYKESNEYNNTLSYSYTVVEKSEIDYTTDPVTGEKCLEGFNEYNFASLYNAGLVTSDSTGFTVASNGSISDATGSASSVYSFALNTNMYFNRAVDKILLDAAAVSGSGAIVNVYDGENTAPVISQEIPSASSVSSYTKELMLDLSEAGLSGSESIRFEIVLSSASAGKDFELRSFRFMYAEIPTVYVNIDESLGTIDAMNSSPDKSAECYGNILISSPEGYVSEYTGKAVDDYSLTLDYIRGRGNSTWEAPKKPYKVKLAKKTDLFGMGKNKHWCLLANFYDKSLMRNKLAYDLAAAIEMPFTPQCVFVDVVMNGEYLGSYLLSEQIRVDDSRVEIDDLEDTPDATDEATISGGYLLEIVPYDRVKSDEVYFGASKVYKAIVFNSPSFENEDGGITVNQAQYSYMEDYYHRMEEAVYSDNGYNGRGEHWTSLLDLDSAVDFYLVEELFKNNDAMYASTRFYKPRGDKLYMGPIWDFDLTAGTYAINYTENPEGWFVKNEYLFSALMRYSEFRNAVKARYWEIHDKITAMYSDTDISQSVINRYYTQIAVTKDLNFDKWGYGNNGWNNILSQGDWDDEVSYLRSWMQRRVNWMDANINGL